jgi:probable HAF family extracellular repeat protein
MFDDEGFVDNNGSYSYFFITTGQAGGSVTAINSAGEIIGNYYGSFVAGAFQPPTGFIIYASGGSNVIGDPGASAGGNQSNTKIGTFVVAINASGEVAGYYKDSNGVPHGFTYSGGTFSNFSDPNAGSMGTLVAGINGSGAVAGYYYDSSGTEHGFTYINGTFSNFNDPNAGSMGTNIAGINDSGEVAGNYYDSSGTEHGFTYINGTFSNFSDPNAGSMGTIVTGINDAGQVVGDYYDSSGVEHGFVADPLGTPVLSGGGNSVNYTPQDAAAAVDGGLSVSDAGSATTGPSAASMAQLVQAMASFGASGAVTSAPGAVLGGADTSQHAILTIPPH